MIRCFLSRALPILFSILEANLHLKVHLGTPSSPMPRYSETRALMEQALRHVLSELKKLLNRSDSDEITEVLLPLSSLAIDTNTQLVENFHRLKSSNASRSCHYQPLFAAALLSISFGQNMEHHIFSPKSNRKTFSKLLPKPRPVFPFPPKLRRRLLPRAAAAAIEEHHVVHDRVL
jgi:hypothetical protein